MTVQRSAVEALSQMAAIVERCVESTIASVLNKLDSIFSIKEPAIALKAFVDKKDVFTILQTRLSKGLIYQLSPSHQKRWRTVKTQRIFLFPLLVTPMEELIREATKLAITALQLGVNSEAKICSGCCQLSFGSPESWQLNNKWQDMLVSTVFFRFGTFKTIKCRYHIVLNTCYQRFVLEGT